jgi:sialic acid synthase SpsE
MKIGRLDSQDRVIVVAEIGNNHEGSPAVARRLVQAAADCGVDAVKFQTFQPAHYVSRNDAARFERLGKFQLGAAEFVELGDLARSLGLLFISTPFDIGSARFLAHHVDAIKIASGDNTFYPLIEAVARFRLPTIVSTGLASLDECRYAAALVRRIWREEGEGADPGLALLHCTSAYPTPPEDANLGAIGEMIRHIDAVIGFSDHTLGDEASVLAVAAGARIIEKHFTLDREFSDFRDHPLSLDPTGMARLVGRIRTAETLMGTGEKAVRPAEAAGVVAFRRSIVAARDLAAGQVLSLEDITWVRPGGGLRAGQERLVIGRRLRGDLALGTPLDPTMVE